MSESTESVASCPGCGGPGLLYTCVHCGKSTFQELQERLNALEKLLKDLVRCGEADLLPRHVIDRAYSLYRERLGRAGAKNPPAMLATPKSWSLHRLDGSGEVLVSTPSGHGVRLLPGDATLGPDGLVLLALANALIDGGAPCTR